VAATREQPWPATQGDLGMLDVNIDHVNGIIDLLVYMILIVGTFGVAATVDFLFRKR
tara:strand:- start:120 stop:290 length:171 start_codon:yes stop_codon:yes gene_type:complete